jgi:hypothetical protein
MSLTLRSPTQIGAALLAVLVLFGAALAIGSVTAPTGTSNTAGPVPTNVARAVTPAINAPAASSGLPALRHPAPKPPVKAVSSTPAPSAPTTSAPAASAPAAPAPVTPAAPATGSGGGGGGGVIISH